MVPGSPLELRWKPPYVFPPIVHSSTRVWPVADAARTASRADVVANLDGIVLWYLLGLGEQFWVEKIEAEMNS